MPEQTFMKVLLVEDNPGDVLLLQEFLSDVASVKVNLTLVERVEEALSYLEKDSFDVILLDLSLPDSQGIETFIKIHDLFPAIPIIVQTGLDDETLATKAVQEGAQDYLVKGQVNGDLLVRSMRYAIERQRSEEALRQSEARFRQIAENIQEVFWMSNPEQRQILYVSPAYETIWGRSCESLYANFEGWMKTIHPLDRQRVETAYFEKVIQGYDQEYRIILPDNSIRWIRDRGFPVKNKSGKIDRIAGIAEDISERKLAEQTIREQAALLDVTSDAIIVRDLENCILFWNKGSENIYGWLAQEVIGKNASEFLYNEEAPPEVETALLTVIAKGKWQGEISKLTKNDKEILVESRWTLVYDETGKPKSILSVDTDITEKKHLQSQLFRAQRLESIGTLASGIAHDLNNILTPILAVAQLLPVKFPEVYKEDEHLLEILEDSAKRGADLVKQVLSFASGVDGKRIPLQMKHLIREVSKIIKQTFPKSLEICIDLPSNLWLVSGDSTQLHQVLMNLCVNARDAMPDGGTLSISAENVFIDENYTCMNLEAKEGAYTVVSIGDTGVGISKEILERIFEPFFTTKEVGKGTGLGLSTVIGIIKSHGGFINVYSEVGKGTLFKVYLRATQDKETVNEEHLQPLNGNGELILVVDDELAIQQITKASLEAHNYQTLIANDGIEAIALYAQHKTQISAVLMDMMLPSLDGLTAIRTLQKMNPKVKIVATTGLMSSPKIAAVSSTGVKTFLPKPYTVKELLHSLQKVLSKK